MLWKKTSLAIVIVVLSSPSLAKTTLKEQRDSLIEKLSKTHSLNEKQTKRVKEIFFNSAVMGQGNPAVTKHPFTREQCQKKLADAKVTHENSDYEKICGAKYMAPLYDPKTDKSSDAKACIDQFEFPNIPCEYPVVWVRANEAADICEAVGKRLCDAHEWEGACESQLLPPDYDFAKVKGMNGKDAFNTLRAQHNRKWAPKKRWAYGPTRKTGNCAMNSTKDAQCNGGDWKKCGSNTYPAGMFPECSGDIKVYDIHGNAAEHMNLPTSESEMASRGSKALGHTEMKGSWFIWDKFQAHQDWCRWRAPYWHGTKVRSADSHHNYHLSFRCCRTL